MGVIIKIFVNLVVLQIDDYYEFFIFDYEYLYSVLEGKYIFIVCLCLLIDGKWMDKVIWGLNWEELLGGEFEKCVCDCNFEVM